MRGRLMTYAPLGCCTLFAALAVAGPMAQAATLPFFASAPTSLSAGNMHLAMAEKQTYPQLPPPPPEKNTDAAPTAPNYMADVVITPEMAETFHMDGMLPENHQGGVDEEHNHTEEMRNAVPADEMLKIRAAAESGDAAAQGELGEMYHEGMGVERDLRKAFYWFRLGAEQEDATSMFYLGRYYKGEFPELQIAKNMDEAEKWLQKSARKSGDMQSMAVLGALLFERVRNGEADRMDEAKWWYNRATGGEWDESYEPPLPALLKQEMENDAEKADEIAE